MELQRLQQHLRETMVRYHRSGYLRRLLATATFARRFFSLDLKLIESAPVGYSTCE